MKIEAPPSPKYRVLVRDPQSRMARIVPMDELPSPCIPVDFRELELGQLGCCQPFYRDQFIDAIQQTAMSYRRQVADAAARHQWWYWLIDRVHHYGGIVGFLLRPALWYMRRQRDLWRYRAEALEGQAVRLECKCYQQFVHAMAAAWSDVLKGVAIRMGLDIEVEPRTDYTHHTGYPNLNGMKFRISGWSYHVPTSLWDDAEGKA